VSVSRIIGFATVAADALGVQIARSMKKNDCRPKNRF